MFSKHDGRANPVDELRTDDENERAPAIGGPVGSLADWMDQRTGVAKGARFMMKKVFPDHWSFMLGEIAMYSLIILLITGTFLTFWYVPSMSDMVYHGSYVPLQGTHMSEAYASTVKISMDIRGGLLIRQIHHWAALLFIVAIMLHMFRIFFTGAFRKPREINWVIGITLFLLADIEGYIGYSLPDDMLSGTGVRAMQGFILSIPFIGSYLSYWIFGGGFPGDAIIPRFFTLHILLLPAAIVVLFTIHIMFVLIHKHTQYPGPGKTDKNVVGFPFFPVYTAKAGGYFFVVFGITALISGLVQIDPVWEYGPYVPTMITAGSQPDWYMAFADGALRLLPGWLEFTVLGHTYSMNVFLASIVIIPVLWTIGGLYPFVEAWVTGDKREHHVLDRPRNMPVRTGLGMAMLTFYGILMVACGNDIIAVAFHLSIDDITNVLRVGLLVFPIVAFVVTKRLCLSLQRHDRQVALHGKESGRLVRTLEGRFTEPHDEIDAKERWVLVSHEPHVPIPPPPDRFTDWFRGEGLLQKARSRISHFYFSDRVEPVTPRELAAVQLHSSHDSIEVTAGSTGGETFFGHLHGGAEELDEDHAYGRGTGSDHDEI